VTDLTTLHAWGKELLAHLQGVPEASTADLCKWGLAHDPLLTPDQVGGLVDELVKAKKVTFEVKPGGRRRTGPVTYRAAPAPCAECARLAEALLSWERQWGRDGTDLAAMEERVRTAETRLAQVTAERDQLAAALVKTAPPEPPPSLSPNATAALGVLSTSRGTSPHEIATRSRILRRSVPHALAELRAAGVAIETTPGLWRRR
jgi:hypothetical protein